MAFKFSSALRNARLDIIQSRIGENPILKIWTGFPPANCGQANQGEELITINLPETWLSAAFDGQVQKEGDWGSLSGTSSGKAGYFRIYNNDLSECFIQGVITNQGEGGDMELDSVEIVQDQSFEIVKFQLTEGNY